MDFWGRFSRAIESADAAYFAAEANLEDVLVLLHAQVADSYFALRTAEAACASRATTPRLQKRSYEITERLFKSGETDELDLQQAKTQYLSTLSSIPELRKPDNAHAQCAGYPDRPPPGPLPECRNSRERKG